MLEIHGGKRPFKCHLCDTRFIQELALSKHFTAIHNDENELKCHICDNEFEITSVTFATNLTHSQLI